MASAERVDPDLLTTIAAPAQDAPEPDSESAAIDDLTREADDDDGVATAPVTSRSDTGAGPGLSAMLIVGVIGVVVVFSGVVLTRRDG